jgi:metallo-beta-lactamase family protein
MVKISFFGAAQEVTGSCFLVETESAGRRAKILIDCGMFQCPKFCDIRTRESFPFDPASIDALFLTHAHIDHSGRIPKLIKDGFRGRIYSSPATRELAELMLKDSTGVLEKEARRNNEPLLYTEADVDTALSLWEHKEFRQQVELGDITISLWRAGHILGSSMILIETGTKKILFTGDLGNPKNPILDPIDVPPGVTHVIMEATYGDREHEGVMERKLKLERVIERSIKRGGVLMVPAFSLERTQELLSEIHMMASSLQIPEVPIYWDSPLAIKATKIYEKHLGIPYFKFPGVHFSLTTEESKAINDAPSPKVIIAGSGMSTGGRILHHERRYMSDKNSTLLFIGFQVPGSLGRRIQDGARSITIFREKIPVRCNIETIRGYSAHPDKDDLFEFVRQQSDSLEHVFAVHAEPKSALAFVQRIRDYLGISVTAPKYGEVVDIS